jgi:hypothetical protein
MGRTRLFGCAFHGVCLAGGCDPCAEEKAVAALDHLLCKRQNVSGWDTKRQWLGHKTSVAVYAAVGASA